MNRLIAKRVLNGFHGVNVRGRALCSDAAAAAAGLSGACSHDHFGHAESRIGTLNSEDHHDIAIVGGGMVGLALACALSSMPLTKQLSVAIVDSNPLLTSKVSNTKSDLPDPRVSTVTPATISFFKETIHSLDVTNCVNAADIGAWQYVEHQRHAYFDEMQVWDYTGLGYTRYNASDVGKEALGCVVENKVLLNSLLTRLQGNNDFEKLFYPARLSTMVIPSHSSAAENILDSNHPGRLAKLELSNGKNIFAKLVIGADGSKSRVREITAIKTTGWNYPQHAVICTVEHATKNQCAWQRFLPSGPIALLPIGDHFSNIVWTMKPEEASNHNSMSEDEFVSSVNNALDHGYGPHPTSIILGSLGDRFAQLVGSSPPSVNQNFVAPPKVMRVVSPRMAFPLSLMHANNYASYRVALIGDAAHTVHPLAGQGVNLGFGDAHSLSKIIAEGILVGSDIGEVSLLKKYEKERKIANVAMMAILDGFQKLFSVDLGPVNLIRAAAFHGAQYIGPLKRNIISYALGEPKWALFT